MILEVVVAAVSLGAVVRWLTPNDARLERTHRMDAAPTEAPLSGTTCVFWAVEARVIERQRISVYGVVVIERAAVEGEAGYRDEGVTIRLVDHPAHRLTLGKAR